MTQSVFDLFWWPLPVAVAWALTRDSEFTESIFSAEQRKPTLLLGITNALACEKATGNERKTYFDTPRLAWDALFQQMAPAPAPPPAAGHPWRTGGRIRTLGTPFVRVADLSGTGSEMQCEIPWPELSSLETDEDGDDLCLIPSDWRVAHSSNWSNLRGYRTVRVSYDGVMQAFPGPGARLIVSNDILCPVPSLDGGGHLPLSQAAYWIATKGGSESIKPEDPAIWRPAFDALLPRIASKEVKIFGRKNGQGPAKKINAHVFSDICVAYPNCEDQMEIYAGNDPYLRCYLAATEDEWRKTFNDALMSRNQILWSHLQVQKSHIKRFRPFGFKLSDQNCDAAPIPIAPAHPPRNHLQIAVRKAALQLWGDDQGPPPGVAAKRRNDAIRSEGKLSVSDATIRRALRSIRTERS